MKRVRPLYITRVVGPLGREESSLSQVSAEARVSVTDADVSRTFTVYVVGPTEDLLYTGVRSMSLGDVVEVAT